MEVDVNYLAVFLAAVSSMVIGAIWYAPKVFGNKWMKWVGLSENDVQTGALPALSLTFLASLLTAYVMAHVTFLSNYFFNNSFLSDALTTSFWLWLGIAATSIATYYLFERKPYKLIILNLANRLVTMLVMGLIIGLLGV